MNITPIIRYGNTIATYASVKMTTNAKGKVKYIARVKFRMESSDMTGFKQSIRRLGHVRGAEGLETLRNIKYVMEDREDTDFGYSLYVRGIVSGDVAISESRYNAILDIQKSYDELAAVYNEKKRVYDAMTEEIEAMRNAMEQVSGSI